jgi:toxin-antitoxin system PIN domain toxin
MKKTSSDLILLDVNVLIAIAWPNHQFHGTATLRLERNDQRWATCAITQLGFIRLSCNPSAVSSPKFPWEAASLLEVIVQDPLHTYFESMPAPAGAGSLEMLKRAVGHKQVTDAYLLELARHHKAVFVTFDSRLQALADGRTKVEVLKG